MPCTLCACISKYLEIRSVRGNRLEAMSVNMFEVEGWRLKAKDKNHSLPKTSSDLRSVLAKAGAILKPLTILSSPQTSDLKQFSALLYARWGHG